MPANSDQQGGKSGKIHFIESILFILALVVGFAPNAQFQGPEREVGTPAPPGRSMHSALKGLACSPIVGSEPLGSWLLVRLADVWAALAPAPHPTRLILHQAGWGGCLCHSLASTSAQLAVLNLLPQALDCGPQGQHPAAPGQGPVSLGSQHRHYQAREEQAVASGSRERRRGPLSRGSRLHPWARLFFSAPEGPAPPAHALRPRPRAQSPGSGSPDLTEQCTWALDS